MLSALSAVEFCSTCSYLALARCRHGALWSFILRAAVLRTRVLALNAVDLSLGAAIWLTRTLGTECCCVLVYVQLSGSSVLLCTQLSGSRALSELSAVELSLRAAIWLTRALGT